MSTASNLGGATLFTGDPVIGGAANWLTGGAAGRAGQSLVKNPIGTISGYLGQQTALTPYGQGQDPASQEQNAAAAAQGFLGSYGNQQALQAQTYAGQQGLANAYQNTISNPYAPSVASAQLGQGVNAANAAALGQAAQATGQNSALANRAAMQQGGAQLAQANAAQAQIRAQEVANAQSGLGAIYASQLGAQGQQANTAAGAASQFSGTNASLANTTQTDNEKAAEANAKANSNMLGTLGGAASTVAALL